MSLPGHKKLGMGRHWHFISVIGWVLTGAVSYVLLFATGQWRRYIPQDWSLFPTAWNDLLTYLSFNLPPLLPGQPLDALQKVAYAAVIFLLAPFQILTGAAQSPAIEARFPWYVRLFGGRQAARSLHALGLLAFLVFIAVHLTMIGVWGWPDSHLRGRVRHRVGRGAARGKHSYRRAQGHRPTRLQRPLRSYRPGVASWVPGGAPSHATGHRRTAPAGRIHPGQCSVCGLVVALLFVSVDLLSRDVVLCLTDPLGNGELHPSTDGVQHGDQETGQGPGPHAPDEAGCDPGEANHRGYGDDAE
ncbi:cytochrome b/b6 domain-containing protein [Streptomyces sp. BB1-1-1]|uniref:cytochrome b/b6 domain-containing protein n=1 Tax=Streptomyces sp. BB1-1-1 TaxID=3074430 RepID=UPI002877FA30|nr:cytochrome b/b6 domain-containing protein [Streptomyces sp. BB1-1-1]WND33690.1 cytochrome b/b6 domain-containing protein [Streptomyces sp. BB1-1-1]